MKKILIMLYVLVPVCIHAQEENKKPEKPLMGIGLKAGLNFANITKVNAINNNSQTGFMIGAFINPPSKQIISSVTEIIFSRQGYQYSTSTNSGNVNLNYILIPQLMGINITKYVQIQLGGQVAYLLNAKADSSKQANGSNPYGAIMDYYNRFDYGAAGGVQIHPVKNLLIGARYNISFGNIYKDASEFPAGSAPSFVPKVNVRNNVLQLYAGFRF